MALGFAVLVTTPVLVMLLALTFVGLGVAALLLVGYVMLALLALMYAGIAIGNLLARRFAHREIIRWHDGVIGMLILSVLTLVPLVGTAVAVLVMTFTAGALAQIFFNHAFSRDE